jgi:hypothetical protein
MTGDLVCTALHCESDPRAAMENATGPEGLPSPLPDVSPQRAARARRPFAALHNTSAELHHGAPPAKRAALPLARKSVEVCSVSALAARAPLLARSSSLCDVPALSQGGDLCRSMGQLAAGGDAAVRQSYAGTLHVCPTAWRLPAPVQLCHALLRPAARSAVSLPTRLQYQAGAARSCSRPAHLHRLHGRAARPADRRRGRLPV